MKTDMVSLTIPRRRIYYRDGVTTNHPSIGIHTQLPSLLHDNAIPASMNLLPRLGDFSPMMIAMQGHYQWAHKMQIWFENLPSKDEVSQFKTLISTLLDLVPDSKQVGNEWTRTYLKMQIDRAYCMLGLRFWQLDQYKGTECHSEVVQYVPAFLVSNKSSVLTFLIERHVLS
jgi:hypothetical protein